MNHGRLFLLFDDEQILNVGLVGVVRGKGKFGAGWRRAILKTLLDRERLEKERAIARQQQVQATSLVDNLEKVGMAMDKGRAVAATYAVLIAEL